MTIPTTLIEPTNEWTKAERFVHDWLIQSDDFQDIVNATDGPGTVEENAAERIRLEGIFDADNLWVHLPQEWAKKRYYGIVTSDKESPFSVVQGQSDVGEAIGTIVCRFSRLVTNAEMIHKRRDIPLAWFKDRVGNICRRLRDWNRPATDRNYISGRGGFKCDNAAILNLTEGSEFDPPTDGSHWLTAHVAFAWGQQI